jgi:hypothetical protein
MVEMDTLEKLVTSLSLEERQKMYEKLQSQSNLSGESLYPASAVEEGELATGDQYARLPWYFRLFYFIMSVFKNKSPHQIFQDSQIAKLGHRIDLEHPGFYRSQEGLLLADFYRLLTGLKNDARFFFDALDVSVNRDRGGFFSFLGSLEMAEVHRRLEVETAPEKVREKNPTVPEAELRQAAIRAMEEAFAVITEDQRTTMYHNARSLHYLKELSSFLYDRVLLAFSGGESCSIHVVKEMLGSLNNILFSMREPPSLALLESLFIFILQEKASQPDFDSNRELQRLLNRAESALVNIRSFNRQAPLTLILRCGNRDMSYVPRQISGGEDWYAMYREYWRRHIGEQFTAYVNDRRYRELREAFKAFFAGEEPPPLENAASPERPGGVPVNNVQALSFLLGFYKRIFVPGINGCLQLVAADGEFLKKENRAEFIGSYNDLAKLGDDIQNFDNRLAPDGILGERYTQARQDMSSLPVKRRKVQLVLEDASEEGALIIERIRTAIDSIVNIISGILKKDEGGKFDSLSNLTQLEAKQPNLSGELQDARQRFKDVVRVLDTITGMETETPKN